MQRHCLSAATSMNPLLHMLLQVLIPALTSSLECKDCDNGGACGMCLNLVSSDECPSSSRAYSHTCDPSQLPMNDLCEADGECGTSNDADNCAGHHHGGRDVYRRSVCSDNAPRVPPSPPDLPLPRCDDLQCDAGASCGICLVLVSREECPESWVSDWTLHTCDKVADGDLCEADGECGTNNDASNCEGRDPNQEGGRPIGASHGWQFQRQITADVYRRVACAYPPSPPRPPSPPPIFCDACDAGSECGICLKQIPSEECPSAYFSDRELRPCDVAKVGELCEADGECGTRDNVDNCRGSDNKAPAGSHTPFWMYRNADVYRVLDCVPPKEVDAAVGVLGTVGVDEYVARQVHTLTFLRPQYSGVGGGAVFLLMLLAFILGVLASVLAVRSGRLRTLAARLGGRAAPQGEMGQAAHTVNVISETGVRTSTMTTPLRAAQGSVGVGSHSAVVDSPMQL